MYISDSDTIRNFVRTCEDGFRMGWHERNGGNLTYRLTKEETSTLKPHFLTVPKPWIPLGIKAENLAGEYFVATGSGKFMRNMPLSPEENLCIVELNATGDAYRIVWGLSKGGKPTSELPSHILNHSVKYAATDGHYRVIYHAHTPSVIALTFLLPLDARVFSRALWRTMTECPIIFPAGVGVMPWMIPGGTEIAIESSKLMQHYDAILWAHHGTFCAGPDLDTTFGLMHTLEKSAEIYLKILSSGQKTLQTISDESLLAVTKAFHVEINRNFLNL